MSRFHPYQPSLLSILAGALLAAGSTASAAQDIDTTEPASDEVSTVIYGGVDYSNARSRGIGVDAGFVHAYNGDLDRAGFTGSVNLGYYHSKSRGYRSETTAGSAIVSYLWPMDGAYVTFGGGVNIVNNDERPFNGPGDEDKVGAIAQYGFETTRSNAFYVQSYGSYSTAFDQVYLHGKLGYMASELRFGAEGTFYDDDLSGKGSKRLGGFIGGMHVFSGMELELSAGYQRGSRSIGLGQRDGVYTMVGFAIPLR